MRKRKRTTATNADPLTELKEIFKKFSKAYWIDEDIEVALKIRKTADGILKSNPELLSLKNLATEQRMQIGKTFYIDYERFIEFPETKTMERWPLNSK